MIKNKILGFILISLALSISAYVNLFCSFGCRGIWGKVYNPLSIIGVILYSVGTFFIFKKKELKFKKH